MKMAVKKRKRRRFQNAEAVFDYYIPGWREQQKGKK